MGEHDIREAIAEKMEKLVAAREAQRRADDEVKKLKNEIGALTVRLAISDGKISAHELSALAQNAMDSW